MQNTYHSRHVTRPFNGGNPRAPWNSSKEKMWTDTNNRKNREDISTYFHSKRPEEGTRTEYTFFPVSTEWQKQKAHQLQLPVLKYMKYGSQLVFAGHTPPENVIAVRGENNKFFRAISTVITGSENDHHRVQMAVRRHMVDSAEFYNAHFHIQNEWMKYLMRIYGSGEIISETDLLATPTFLQTVLMIYTPRRKDGILHFKWEAFPPLNRPEMTYPVIYLFQKDNRFDPVLSISPSCENGFVDATLESRNKKGVDDF